MNHAARSHTQLIHPVIHTCQIDPFLISINMSILRRYLLVQCFQLTLILHTYHAFDIAIHNLYEYLILNILT